MLQSLDLHFLRHTKLQMQARVCFSSAGAVLRIFIRLSNKFNVTNQNTAFPSLRIRFRNSRHIHNYHETDPEETSSYT
jgi:hypothetical protein